MSRPPSFRVCWLSPACARLCRRRRMPRAWVWSRSSEQSEVPLPVVSPQLAAAFWFPSGAPGFRCFASHRARQSPITPSATQGAFLRTTTSASTAAGSVTAGFCLLSFALHFPLQHLASLRLGVKAAPHTRQSRGSMGGFGLRSCHRCFASCLVIFRFESQQTRHKTGGWPPLPCQLLMRDRKNHCWHTGQTPCSSVALSFSNQRRSIKADGSMARRSTQSRQRSRKSGRPSALSLSS
jgi:hypothetical protein